MEGVLPFGTALGLVLVLELGDKTQLAVIVLAAAYAAPVSVFAGAGLGLAAIASLSVVIGRTREGLRGPMGPPRVDRALPRRGRPPHPGGAPYP